VQTRISKPFWITAGILLIIISIGVAFQRPYISLEVRHISDENQILRLLLENQAKEILDIQISNPDLYKTRLIILRTQDLDGLDVPSAVNKIPIVVVNWVEFEKLGSPVYSSIKIEVHGFHGEITIDNYLDLGGREMSTGLTLYCSKTANVWKVDYGEGWVP
jgi:hypothetical protein